MSDIWHELERFLFRKCVQIGPDNSADMVHALIMRKQVLIERIRQDFGSGERTLGEGWASWGLTPLPDAGEFSKIT